MGTGRRSRPFLTEETKAGSESVRGGRGASAYAGLGKCTASEGKENEVGMCGRGFARQTRAGCGFVTTRSLRKEPQLKTGG